MKNYHFSKQHAHKVTNERRYPLTLRKRNENKAFIITTQNSSSLQYQCNIRWTLKDRHKIKNANIWWLIKEAFALLFRQNMPAFVKILNISRLLNNWTVYTTIQRPAPSRVLTRLCTFQSISSACFPGESSSLFHYRVTS